MSDLIPQQSLRSRIKEDFLTCSICFNNFTQPKALPCLHTYCLECLQSYVTSCATEGTFPCPMCRQVVPIPQQGLNGLPDNYMVSNLVDTVEETSNTPVVPPRPSPIDVSRLNKPIPAPRSVSPQPPRSPSPSPVIPPRPKSVSPVPTHDLSSGEPNTQHYTGAVGGNFGKLVTDSIEGVVGAVGTAISDISGYLKPPRPVNTQDTPTSPFEFVPRPEDNANNNSQTQEGQTAGLYPALVTAGGASPCSHGLLISFGKYGQTVNSLMKPYGLAVGKQGEFVLSDKAGNRLFVFSNTGELKLSFITKNCMVNGVSITVDNKILLAVSKSGSAIMRLYSMEGKLLNSYGNFHKYDIASGITVTPSNHVAVTNLEADNVIVFTEQRKLSVKVGRKGHGQAQFTQPSFVASTSKNYLVVSDTGNNSIKLFDITGNFKRCFGSPGSNHGQLNSPLGVATDNEDFIIVADSRNFRVEIFTVKGEFYTTLVKDTNLIGPDVRPINVAVTPKNNIAVLLFGTGFCEVRVFQWRPLARHGLTV